MPINAKGIGVALVTAAIAAACAAGQSTSLTGAFAGDDGGGGGGGSSGGSSGVEAGDDASSGSTGVPDTGGAACPLCSDGGEMSTDAGGAGGEGGSGGSASGSGGSSAGSASSSGGSASGGSSGSGGSSASSSGGSASSSGGVDAGVVARTFGGVYAAGGKTCTSTACYTQNPAAADACACPSGFTASMPIDFIDNRGCPSNNPPYGWTAMTVCYAGAFTAASDFGGFYQHQGTTCTVSNPMASGSCACPSGSQAIEFIVDGSCYVNDNVDLCWNPTAAVASFGGAYQVSDNASYGTGGCVVKNPATNACSCPTGTTAVALENEYGPSTSGCSNAGISSGNLYVCTVP